MLPNLPAAGRGRSGIAMAVALTAIAYACASTPDNRLLVADADRFERALLLPLNVVVDMPTELADGADRVAEQLRTYLVERGKAPEAIAFVDAHNAWLASAAECKENAQQGCSGFTDAAGILARRLSEGRDAEVVLVPYLLTQSVRTQVRNANWDGVHREIEVVGFPAEGPVSLSSITIPAPSLAILAFSRTGEPLFRGVGGLDLAHRVRIIPSRSSAYFGMGLELRDDLFDDPEALREGVGIALDPLVPNSDAELD
jgi:hypothetical protein